MESILAGLIKFRTQDYEEHKNLFCRLKNRQEPHTLFIACSDSRVVPELITKSLPGELFVVRNIANIIPKYHQVPEDLMVSATTAAIEYAVQVLKVKSIIVCGHSNCGGCASIYLPDTVLDNIPNVKKWLELAENVKTRVLDELDSKDDQMKREWLTEQMNIVEQIKHLLTYPFIVEKFNKKELDIVGMYYTIETGEVFIYNAVKGLFELVN
ncbi:carbonic anhydrase [Desulfosporosinus sp. BICA1-9]|uniref:carbonic anhydrase n=1 Tax=Desulfosporosinus sp. BICA1-9 TaxID=1531958 RepID=UPI00054BADAA|nr:carbonic anhydrase [Desulfosporosinus sp. BICA1-9]KJS46076.1 MAG: carbonic anhydrase [Peptococcaceae bacterium BRH_c23]KJS90651.1 MAG: carbonic anhydrase [Desulfosporosinus sp. BICA1-9]HBW38675.1 carbonic anhydrase [Desulfosporosinus sp.]